MTQTPKKVTQVKTLPELKRRIRVAAYARVSTDKDAMLHSLTGQIFYYKKLISQKPEWEFAGVYADEGISGTKENRPEFQKMIKEAKAGNIDLILTKAVSRFARNTQTLLTIIRDLKRCNVDVYFEEQNLHTSDSKTELMLNIMSSIAESEARSVSENMYWRIKRDFQKGLLWGGDKCYGYKIVNRRLVLNPDEAEVVKRIFRLYLSGLGDYKIANLLNDENIPTHQGGPWRKQTITGILTNRHYTGDLVLQKTYTIDCLTKLKKKNKGEKNLYLVENDHEPIIEKEIFSLVQKIRNERMVGYKAGRKEKGHHLFDDIFYCCNCGRKYSFKKGQYQNSYMCGTARNDGKKYCNSKQLPERIMIDVITKELNLTDFNESVMRKKIDKIIVKNGNLLDFYYKNGVIKEVHWDDPKRSEGWTLEMKEVARKRTIEMNKRRKENVESNSNQTNN